MFRAAGKLETATDSAAAGIAIAVAEEPPEPLVKEAGEAQSWARLATSEDGAPTWASCSSTRPN
jgi:hypothetical protein